MWASTTTGNFIVDGGETTSISDLLKHVHHFLELGGENTIALGSDFDGADIPGYLDSVEKVDNLYDALLADGLGKELAEKTCSAMPTTSFGTTSNKGRSKNRGLPPSVFLVCSVPLIRA